MVIYIYTKTNISDYSLLLPQQPKPRVIETYPHIGIYLNNTPHSTVRTVLVYKSKI